MHIAELDQHLEYSTINQNASGASADPGRSTTHHSLEAARSTARRPGHGEFLMAGSLTAVSDHRAG